MHRLSITSLCVALLSVSSFVGPAAAATPNCDGTIDMESEAANDFADSLRLRTKLGASVVVWGGCFKVQYIGADGKYVTEYYDMDTRSRADLN